MSADPFRVFSRSRHACPSTAALLAAYLAGPLCIATLPAAAADLEWTNPASTSTLFFNTPTNWTPSQTPTAADNLLFQIDQAGNPIIFNAGSLSNDLTVADQRWVFSGLATGNLTTTGVARIDGLQQLTSVQGARLELTDAATWNIVDPSNAALTDDNRLIVGDTGEGRLTASSASTIAAEQVFVGAQAGSIGDVLLQGVGTTLTATLESNTGLFVIGDNGGRGKIGVIDGAKLLTTDTTDSDIHVGRGTFDDGTNPPVQSRGFLFLDGPGSSAETGDLYVGYQGGDGLLTVTGGAEVVLSDGTSPDLSVGFFTGSEGIVEVAGPGSSITARRINVSQSGGQGIVVISDGGVVQTALRPGAFATNNGDVFVGDNLGGLGRINLQGSSNGTTPTLLDVASNLIVGDRGTGQLRVTSGNSSNGSDAIVNANNVTIGQQVGDDEESSLRVLGPTSELNATGLVTVGQAGRGLLEVFLGSLDIGNNLIVGNVGGQGRVTANAATIDIGGTLILGLEANGSGVVELTNGTTLNTTNLFFGNSNGSTAVSEGQLFVRSGSDVVLSSTTNGVVTLGDDTGTVGGLTVTGSGSSVSVSAGTGEWWVGGSSNDTGGTGTLEVLDGATVTTGGRLLIGVASSASNNAQGTVTVDGNGSTLNVGNDFIHVGSRGLGDLNVTGGGNLNALNMSIADLDGSDGSQALIDGAGTVVNLQRRLTVGDENQGSLVVSGGAQLNVALNAGTLAENRRLIVGLGGAADGSSLTVTGPGSRLDYHDTENVRIGFNGGSTTQPATVRVENGGVLSAVQRNADQTIATQGSIILGDDANGNGRLIIDGPGSLVEGFTLDLGQGSNASGTLQVSNGGRLALTNNIEVGDAGTSSQTNFLDVSGENSRVDAGTELTIGATGGVRGLLAITDGAVVTNGTDAFIGLSNGTQATASIGANNATRDARWNVGGDLYIAGNRDLGNTGSFNSGSGTLNLRDRGVLEVAGFAVLKDRGTLNLEGGTFIADDLIFQNVAAGSDPDVNFNAGTLRYTDPNGKTLDASQINVLFSGGPALLDEGKHLAIDGLANITAPIQLNGGTLSVGAITNANLANVNFEAGTLNFTDSSLIVTSTGPFGSALIIDQDETIHVNGQLNVGNDGILNVVRGSVSANSSVNFGTIVITDATATFNGILDNRGDVVLIDATLQGSLSNSNGDLTIVNDATVGSLQVAANGSLNLGVDTNTNGPSDMLNVLGDAFLDGTLNVSASNPNNLAVGDEFDLILADAITGTFSSEQLPTLGDGLAFDVLYEANRVALAVVQVITNLAGDYNGSGAVEQGDLDLVLANWGRNTGPRSGGIPEGWINDLPNGAIDQEELDGVLTNWGSQAAPNFAGSQIPEPATTAAAALLATTLLRRRRHQNR